jgi:hypothetical protein
MLILLSSAVAGWPAPSSACSVPVFRYALERWPADAYEVVLFHRAPLSAADQKIVALLEEERDVRGARCNLALNSVDLAGEVTPAEKALWEAQATKTLPWLVVRYPKTARVEGAIWSGQLSAENVRLLRDSPIRRETAQRIRKGETAVWVLLESGNRDKDQAAAKLLEAQLQKMPAKLKLPEAAKDDPEDPPNRPPGPPVRIDFSLLRLSRTDPAEAILVNMLLNSEDDLKTLHEPMAFPIFGRGRALFALVGAGITADNIADACAFLVGACSCRVKEMNPGTDLLMTADWDDLTTPAQVQDEPLPPLTGVALPSADAAVEPCTSSEPSGNWFPIVLYSVLGLGITVVGTGSLLLWKWKKH